MICLICLLMAVSAFIHPFGSLFGTFPRQASTFLNPADEFIHLAFKEFQLVLCQACKSLFQPAFGNVPVSFGYQCAHFINSWLYLLPARRHMDLILLRKDRAGWLINKARVKTMDSQAFQSGLNGRAGDIGQTRLQTANARAKIVCMLHPPAVVFGCANAILPYNPPPAHAARSQLNAPQMPDERPLVTQLVADAGLLIPASSLIGPSQPDNGLNSAQHPQFFPRFVAGLSTIVRLICLLGVDSPEIQRAWNDYEARTRTTDGLPVLVATKRHWPCLLNCLSGKPHERKLKISRAGGKSGPYSRSR
jgi:hypothetical protein